MNSQGPTSAATKFLVTLLLFVACHDTTLAKTSVSPLADPANKDGWHLNASVSDEFEGKQLDQSKWFIQGTDGKYQSNFIGRAPSQFSTDNVRVEDGKLKLQARWEPDFKFSPKIDKSDKKVPEGRRYENITTAAVISKNLFLYGYMEIKCKAADASVTSTFWMTGNNTELDVFEFLARPAQTHKKHLESELWSSIHDWSKAGGGKSTWTDRLQLGWRVADDFHVYGIEWDESYLKFHADGKLVRSVTRKEIGEESWVIKNPLMIWVDSETFPWHGIPVESDLPVDYEIEYIRVWQKNLSDNIFFSFEGPAFIDGENKDWWIAEDSRKNFSVVDEKAAIGSRSLRFTHSSRLESAVTTFAPYGSMSLEPGEYEFSMKVWLEPNCSVKRVSVVFQDPWRELSPFDLTGLERGKWVTLTQSFRRTAASGAKDRPRIVIQQDDVSGDSSTLYIDDLSFEKKL